MARIFGIHDLDLKPGVTDQELEETVRAIAAQPVPGWKLSLAKGDRNTRTGKYALIFETDDAARDRLVPEGGPSEEGAAVLARFALLDALCTEDYPWTDYRVVLESE
jgi:hypothetical protein